MLDINMIQPYVRSASTFIWRYNNAFHSVAYDHRLFYVAEGAGSVSVAGIEFSISEGSLMLFAPGTPYLLRNRNDAYPMRIMCINFDFSYNHSNLNVPIQPSIEGNFNESLVTERQEDSIFGMPLCRGGLGMFKSDIIEIYSCFVERRIFFEGRVSAILKMVLTELAQIITAGNERHGQVVRLVLSFISENYMHDITNDSVARELGYHPYYLSELIRRNTGVSLHRYIINFRVNRALSLILESDLPLSEIYWRCGFKTQSHFTVCFKRVFGAAPSDYRNGLHD